MVIWMMMDSTWVNYVNSHRGLVPSLILTMIPKTGFVKLSPEFLASKDCLLQEEDGENDNNPR